MSLFTAMNTAVAGLSAQARKMGHISENIANVSTVSYKKISTDFFTLVTQSGRSMHTPGGVRSSPYYNVGLQGQMQSSATSTHMGINGGGFFIVRNFPDETENAGLNRKNFYTRRGDFNIDSAGNLVNTAGYYLMGRRYDITTGEILPGDLVSVNVANMAGIAVGTNKVTVGANLPAESAAAAGSSQTSLYNSATLSEVNGTGSEQNYTVNYTRTNPNGTSSSSTLTIPVADGQSVGAAMAAYFDAEDAFTATFTNGVLSITGPTGVAFTLDDTASSDVSLGTDALDAYGTAQTTTYNAATLAVVNNTGAGQTYTVNYTRTNPNGSTTSTALTIPVADGQSVGAAMAEYLDAHDDFTATFANGVLGVTGLNGVTFTLDDSASSDNSLDIDALDTIASTVAATAINTAADYGISTVDPGFVDHFAEQNYYDSQGQAHTLRTEFVKAFDNTWEIRLVEKDGDGQWTQIFPNADDGHITVRFNADGTMASVAPAGLLDDDGRVLFDPGEIDPDVNASLGTRWQWAGDPIEINIGQVGSPVGLTQFSSEYSLTDLSQNGLPYGQFSSVQVDAFGDVYALYGNGATIKIYHLPLAAFSNPDGLQNVNGNAYEATAYSGDPSILSPGVGRSGTVVSQALEASNVDIAEEFTQMIQTQRAYSANSRVITTSDQMLDEIIRLK